MRIAYSIKFYKIIELLCAIKNKIKFRFFQPQFEFNQNPLTFLKKELKYLKNTNKHRYLFNFFAVENRVWSLAEPDESLKSY